MALPVGDFTPFGYLKNPAHRATEGWQVEGGNLRSAPDWLGVEWVYPHQRRPTARQGLRLTRPGCETRQDFDAIGLISRYHTCNILGFDWVVDGVAVAARYFLVDDHTLCVRLTVTNIGPALAQMSLDIGHSSWESGPTDLHHVPAGDVGNQTVRLAPGEAQTIVAALGRGPSHDQAQLRANDGLANAAQVFEVKLEDDKIFYRTCPELTGDWPATWREGLLHDFETTRLLVQPAGGIFRDVWPTWMATWPRVVLAEGALDMLRLAYADPALAQRAVLSMFRDAPMPNVPCVFEDGSFNMVAADGSRCGTSPAWCLPFLNLELLYLRSVDRVWLRELIPYLTAYLDWWLAERTDAEGWVVYKCTWEAGEDGNPRLDPTGSGDGVISDRVRPVELQATMAHAGEVMAFFAHELGLDPSRWRDLADLYRARTRLLFDGSEGRYRDWLTQDGCFQPSLPEQPYWNTDSIRNAPSSLTPLLIGEPLDAPEIWRHACPPWTLWPSWTWALVESASAAGHFAEVGEIAASIIDRVYPVTTRRELGSLERPMPGAAPEFWPEDWRTFDGSDAYGWGATTANLLLRHVFGFRESRSTDRWTAVLTPNLPPGAQRFGVRNMLYRGLLFDLSYATTPAGLEAHLDLRDAPRHCRIVDGSNVVFVSNDASTTHSFTLTPGHAVALELS